MSRPRPLRSAGPARTTGDDPGTGARAVVVMALLLAGLTTVSALRGLTSGGGQGPHDVTTARGAEVTLYGEGLYADDTWLVGAGNRGQDLVLILVEVPVLLLALRRWTRADARTPAPTVVLTGVLAFFAYYWTSMTFATAQNPLFPLYVTCLGLCAFLLSALARRVDVQRCADLLPARPGARPLATYLLAVAAALTLAWLPGMIATAARGDAGAWVGPYTSAVTEALDLGLVVPVTVVAAALLLRDRPAGAVLTLVVLVVNVCIGLLLVGQGTFQLVDGVPLTPAEIIAKMATFAVLTLVAGGLVARMRFAERLRPGPTFHDSVE